MEQHADSAFSPPSAGKPVLARFDGGRLTSGAGVLMPGDIDQGGSTRFHRIPTAMTRHHASWHRSPRIGSRVT
jgi:hypothetical protein